MPMDCSITSSEISFHELPSKSKRPSIRKQIASSLSSQLIVLVFTKQPSAERYLGNILSPVFLRTFRKFYQQRIKIRSKKFQKVHKKNHKVAGFYRSNHQMRYVKKVFLERFSQNSQEKACVRDSILINIQIYKYTDVF